MPRNNSRPAPLAQKWAPLTLDPPLEAGGSSITASEREPCFAPMNSQMPQTLIGAPEALRSLAWLNSNTGWITTLVSCTSWQRYIR